MRISVATTRGHLLPVFCLAALVAAALWGEVACAEGVTLQLSPQVGDRTWYRLTMDGTTEISGSIAGGQGDGGAPGSGQAMPVRIEILFSVEVKSKDENSNSVIEQRIHDLEMTAMGMDMSQMLSEAKGAPITVTQDRFANVLKVEGLSAKSGGGPLNPAGFTAVTLAPRVLSFPEAAVSVGDTWELQSSKASREQLRQPDSDMHATLVSLEDKDGEQRAKIKVLSRAAPELEGALPGQAGAAKVSTETEALFLVRVSDGKVLSMDGAMTSEISSGGEGGFRAKSKMELSMVEAQAPLDLEPDKGG